MTADLLITNIGQLVTCASGGKPKRGAEMRDVRVIQDCAVAIAGGKFVGVGEREVVERQFSADEVFDADGRTVCPGFVDPHTHIVFAGDRLDEFELKIKGADYLEILAAGGGILSTVSKTREADEDELFEGGRRRLDQMLRCGTTTAEVKTGYGLDLETELKMLRVIERLDREHSVDLVPTFLPAHAVPSEFKDRGDDYVKLVCDEMLPAACEWHRASHFSGRVPFFIDVFAEKNAFDIEQTAKIFSAAAKLGFSLKAHVDEFTNLGGSSLAIEAGAVSIDHLDAISEKEIEILAASATIGVITPAVNFNFGSSRFADARKMIDSGCAVAIATDYNPGSAPCPSQPLAMAIACRYQNILPAEAFNAATVNAAHALGLGDVTGSVEAGKRADLLICECDDYRQMVYEFGGNLVKQTVKCGDMSEFC
jgi:imidazolonepropionase